MVCIIAGSRYFMVLVSIEALTIVALHQVDRHPLAHFVVAHSLRVHRPSFSYI
jgi:hypothetical protein